MRLIVPALLLAAVAAVAHVGSPDIFFEGEAGPYRLLVTIRPPAVIPGVAEIEVRSSSPGIGTVRIVPLPLSGPGAKFAPTPDQARRSAADPQFFTGSLWMMAPGSWQVRVTAEGARGEGQLAVPVPALASRTSRMQKGLGGVLLALGVLLGAGIISIAGAGVREGPLEPGAAPDAARLRRSRRVMLEAAVVVLGVAWLGNAWWNAEAGTYERYVFKPLQLESSLEAGGRLLLTLKDPGWLRWRRVDDLIPDHNHLMHMYLIRLPEMERVWHLHPEPAGPGALAHRLPAIPAGRYQIYGDIVHENGFPETVAAEIDLPAVAGAPLTGDDSAGAGPPLAQADYNRTVAELSGGYRMVWERDAAPLRTRRPTAFRFRIEDAQGRPATDLELYMGMPGHAAFLGDDRSVFAHVHPSGSVPMASLSLTQAPGADPHAGHAIDAPSLPPAVSFPYGFPKAGNYRIFVQVKRAGRVEMGVFDARVEN
jgi:hypothetical protein